MWVKQYRLPTHTLDINLYNGLHAMVICLLLWSESMTDKLWSRDRKILKNFLEKTKEMFANCEQKVCKLSGAKFVMFCKQFANISWVFFNKILRTIFFYRCGGICSVKLSEHRSKQLTLLNWSRYIFKANLAMFRP